LFAGSERLEERNIAQATDLLWQHRVVGADDLL
jgi:hypothetical protein